MTVQDIDWKNPIAVVSFGTGRSSLYMVERIIKILLKMGYKVIFAAGGQRELMTILPEEPKLFKFLFAPLQAILPTAALIISHGGQMTVFESLIHKVPVVVMPYQPEQLHNGLCLERLQCGMRLIIPAPFRGNTKIYEKALEKTSDLELETKINAMVNNPLTSVQLENMSKIIINYNGPDMLAELIEG
jgi:UDP:flavonoid glycosyltransferase YjiC (YdhE family)